MNQPAEFDRTNNLKAILGVRHEAPELEGSWQIHYLPPVPTDIPGIQTIPSEYEWLRGKDLRIPTNGRFDVPGHGSVGVHSCYGTDLDRHVYVIFRGGLAVAYLSEKHSRPGETGSVFSPRDQTRHVVHAQISWIEPGVSDHERRERKRKDRLARRREHQEREWQAEDLAEARSLEQGRQEEIWEAGQQANYDRQVADDNARWNDLED